MCRLTITPLCREARKFSEAESSFTELAPFR